MTHHEPRIVLASASPRRQRLLAEMLAEFSVHVSDVPEETLDGESPTEMAIRLSLAKASEVSRHHPHTLIVAADTIVVLDGRVLGKPVDHADARRMLSRLRGRVHHVYTGLAVVDGANGTQCQVVARTPVEMRKFADEEVAEYVSSGDPMDKAGAYAIQHDGFTPVESISGCYANVMGLPLCHLVRALRVWDVNPPVDVPAVCQSYTGELCEVFSRVLGA